MQLLVREQEGIRARGVGIEVDDVRAGEVAREEEVEDVVALRARPLAFDLRFPEGADGGEDFLLGRGVVPELVVVRVALGDACRDETRRDAVRVGLCWLRCHLCGSRKERTEEDLLADETAELAGAVYGILREESGLREDVRKELQDDERFGNLGAIVRGLFWRAHRASVTDAGDLKPSKSLRVLFVGPRDVPYRTTRVDLVDEPLRLVV